MPDPYLERPIGTLAQSLLLDSWVDRYLENTCCVAVRINISADFHVKNALEKLNRAKLEPARYLNDGQDTVVSHAMSFLDRSTVSRDSIEEFLAIFGHRAPLDYELSEPRFSEDMQLMRQYIERSQHKQSGMAANDATIDENCAADTLPDSKVLAISIQRAQTFHATQGRGETPLPD